MTDRSVSPAKAGIQFQDSTGSPLRGNVEAEYFSNS